MFWHMERVRTLRSLLTCNALTQSDCVESLLTCNALTQSDCVKSLLTCNVLAHGEGSDSEVLTDM